MVQNGERARIDPALIAAAADKSHLGKGIWRRLGSQQSKLVRRQPESHVKSMTGIRRLGDHPSSRPPVSGSAPRRPGGT